MKYRVWCNKCQAFVGEATTDDLNDRDARGDSLPYRQHLLEAHCDRSVTLSYSLYGGSEHTQTEEDGWSKLEAMGVELGAYNPETKTWEI